MSGRWEGGVSIELGGRTYTGHYRVDDEGILHVSHGPDRKSTHHRRPDSPVPMARILLRELLATALKDGM